MTAAELERLPEGARVSVDASIDDVLEYGERQYERGYRDGEARARDTEATWRERLWRCPAETRLDVEQVCEAVGKSRSWLYHLTSAKEIPHRKRRDGTLVFVAGEVREWLKRTEVVTVAGRRWFGK